MTELRPFQYPATLLTRDSWPFSILTFYVEAGDISAWSGVYRKEISQQGYQRILKPEHANQIKKFLTNSANVIPNSVVIAFNDELDIEGKLQNGASFEAMWTYNPVNADGSVDTTASVELGMLTVHVHERVLSPRDGDTDVTLSEFRSAYVIDGQHRIQGGNSVGDNVYLPVTAFLGITREEQAFHFIVINRKARRVSKHDIDSVIPERIYEGLQRRLVDAGIMSSDADLVYGLDNLDDSPFKGLIKWANNPNPGVIPKGAIDSLLKEARRLPKDELEAFDDNELDLYCSIWRGVRRHLESLWHSPIYEKAENETYKNQLLEKAAGVFPAIQRMLVNAFEQGAIALPSDAEDPSKAFEEAVYKYVKTIPLELFYCRWTAKSITNDARISELVTLLTKAKRTSKVPYDDQKGWFLKPESIEITAAKKRLEAEQKRKARAAAKRKRTGTRKAVKRGKRSD